MGHGLYFLLRNEMSNDYNVFNVVKDALAGELQFASPEVAQSRMDICNDCEARNKLTNVCTACGCFLPAKTKLAKSSCPMDLWSSVDTD